MTGSEKSVGSLCWYWMSTITYRTDNVPIWFLMPVLQIVPTNARHVFASRSRVGHTDEYLVKFDEVKEENGYKFDNDSNDDESLSKKSFMEKKGH